MFYREIDPDLKLALNMPHFAPQIYALIDQNRAYLKAWLPWLDRTTEEKNVADFIKFQLVQLAEGKGLNCVILYKDNPVGLISYNALNSETQTGYIGYWLAQDYNGKGIMSRAVEKLLEIGFNELNLHKIEIRCATENKPSRAIPERLGFKKEGIIRNSENLNGQHVDHIVYGLMKEEWSAKYGN